MKEKSAKIISITFGIFAFLLTIPFFVVQILSISSNLFVVLIGLIGGLFNLVFAALISFLFIILGFLILFNSISFSYSLSDPNKNSRRLVFIGLFLFIYSAYQCANIFFQVDWYNSEYTIALLLFSGVLLSGILSIATGFLRVYFINVPKTDDLYIIKKKKFFKKIKKAIVLTLLFLVVIISFNIYKINKMGCRREIKDLEKDGKLVFLRINSSPFSPKSEAEDYYNGNNLCMVDLHYPKEINCFDESSVDPYWGPDGENIFYAKGSHTIVYNIINKEKEILDDHQKTYNDNYGLYGILTKLKEAQAPPNAPQGASISPDGKKSVYLNRLSICLLKEGDIRENATILLEYIPHKHNSFSYPIWYSNTEILFEGKITNSKIFTNDRYISGFFLMNEDGSNIRSLIPDNDDYFYYKSPNLYR